MRMTTLSWVVALAITVVAIGLRKEVTKFVASSPRNYVSQNLGPPPNSIMSSRQLSDDSRLGVSDALPLANINSSDKPVENAEPHDRPKDHKDIKSPNSTAEIGRPFPVSASVEAACKKLSDYICNDVQEKLLEMSREPRDSQWASEMEVVIEDDILSKEQPGRFSIRDIECRTTLCATEVQSNFSTNGTYGGYMGGMGLNHDALNAALHTNFSTFASETDSTGARIVVTLITFTRR